MATALHLAGEACPSSIRPVRELVAGIAREHGLSKRGAGDLELCVHEAMANVLEHAYGGRAGPVDVSVDDLGNSLAVVVSDHQDAAHYEARGDGWIGLWLMTHLAGGCTVCATSDGMEIEMTFPVPSRTARGSEPTGIGRKSELLHP